MLSLAELVVFPSSFRTLRVSRLETVLNSNFTLFCLF